MDNFPVLCDYEYWLNSYIFKNSEGVIKRELLCKGLKTSYTSGANVETIRKNGDEFTIDALVDILVGSNQEENDDDIGFPIRVFKYIVDISSSSTYPTIYYKYSY